MADGSSTIVARALATRHGLAFVDLWAEPLDEVALHALPEAVLRRAHAVPYKLDDGFLHVAVADPKAAQTLQEQSRYPLVLAVAAREQIAEALTSLVDTKTDSAWRSLGPTSLSPSSSP